MAAPSTPSNFNLQQGNGQTYLSWDITAGATTYVVQRSADGVTFSTIASPAVNNYLDSSVSVNTLYYYQVAASNGTVGIYTSALSIIPTLAGIDSLAALRLQAQQRADRVNSNFVSMPEWNMYINKSLQELYDLLVTCYEDYYLAPEYVFQTDGSNSYLLPNGVLTGTDSVVTKQFYKLLGVDCGISNSQNPRIPLAKYDFINRNDYIYPNVTSTYFGVFNMRYRVMGNRLHFIPTPSAGQYITVHYIPKLEALLKDTDIADYVSGWTEYVIVDAAIKALQKEEQDVSVLMAEKQMLKQRIEESAQNRDAGQPDTISNTRGKVGGNGTGGGPGYGGGSFGGW